MRTIGLIFLLIFFHPLFTNAQEDLVDLNLVTFHSDIEKKVLTDHFRKGNSDNFLLFMAPGSLLSDSKVGETKSRFYQHVHQFKDEKFASRKNDKKTKQIYDDIHQTYLKKFLAGTGFEEIFVNGVYNSISATALYAITFEHLNIPYEIKEEPDNVYLVAYPNAEKIKVEATSPLKGILTFNDPFKQQYVKALKDQKIISAQEFSSMGVNALFDKYYYGNQQNINLQNLLGLQYLSDAQAKFEAKNLDAAYAQAEKAYLLYPCPKTAYTLVFTGSNAFDARKQMDSIKAIQLAKLSRYKNHGITTDMVYVEFSKTINDLLFEHGKKAELDYFYRVFNNAIDNFEIQNEISFLYNYETARYFYNQAKFKEALPLFEKALSAKPDKQDAVTAFISTLGNQLASSGNHLDNLKAIEGYANKYSMLQNNNIFNNMLLSAYLLQIAMEYDSDNYQQGEKYRLVFEDLKNKYPDVQPNPVLIGQAYSRAAVYFYKKGQTQKAKNLLATGLKFSPNNYELVTRQRMIH